MKQEILDLISQTDIQCRLYGAILFTEAHPYVVKTLKDDEFWNALDELSGSSWVIFATRLFKGSWEPPALSPKSRGFMHPVWKEPAANNDLLECFEIKDSTRPYFVIFGFNDEQLFYATHPIAGESANAVYQSLEEVVRTVSRELEIRCDAAPLDLYKALNLRLRMLRAKDFLKRAFQWVQNFRGVTGV